MSNDWIPEASQCPDKRLHDYRTYYRDGKLLADKCQRCGSYKTWNLHNGKVMNEEGYLESHLRDFLQPVGYMREQFIKEYGKDIYEMAIKAKEKQSTPSLDDIAKEAKREIKNPISVQVNADSKAEKTS